MSLVTLPLCLWLALWTPQATRQLSPEVMAKPAERLTATAAAFKKLEEPLEEIAEGSEGLLKKIILMTRPIGPGDLAKVKEYAAAFEKRRTEVRALQAGMRARPAR